MRLFVATPSHYLHGGVERILEALGRELPRRGIDLTFGLAKGLRFHDPARFRAEYPHLKTVDVDGTSGSAYGRRKSLRRAILAHDPDVVLNVRVFDAYPVCAALKQEGHRLRFATTVQAFESDYLVDLKRYEEFVDAVMTSGELIARAVRQFTSVEDVVSIPGGVASPRRMRVAHGGPLRIGYVGRIEQLQKRILDLPLLVGELDRRLRNDNR
jgi:hypothetical protein